MLTHYLKVAFRNLMKYKLQSSVSIIGLAVGLVCFSLSVLWLRYIETFDDFHRDADRLCVFSTGYVFEGDGRRAMDAKQNMPDVFSENLAEIEGACLVGFSRCRKNLLYRIVAENGRKELADRCEMDSTFFSVFDMRRVAGKRVPDRNEALLTETMARKLFGDSSAIGKTISIEPGNDYTVVGVVEEWKGKSVFHFDIVTAKEEPADSVYHYSGYSFFVRLHKGVNLDSLNSRLQSSKYQVDDVLLQNQSRKFIPINRVVTEVRPDEFMVRAEYVWYFMMLGCIIILCALCNYCVLLVTHIRIRSREMALRKLLGSSTMDIVMLVATESVMLFAVVSFIGLLITVWVIPSFRIYSNVDTPVSSIVVEIVVYILLSVLAGLLVVSVTVWIVMKTTYRSILSGHVSRSGSRVVDKVGSWVQLTLCLSCILCVTVIMMQLHSWQTTNTLGINRKDVGLLRCTDNESSIPIEIKKFIKESPLTKETVDSCCSVYPILQLSLFKNTIYDCDNRDDKEDVLEVSLSDKCLRFFDIKPIEGEYPKDYSEGLVVNESYRDDVGESPVGKRIKFFWGEVRTIKGVIPNIYFDSPLTKPVKMIIDNTIVGPDFLFRAYPGKLPELMEQIEQKIEKMPENEYVQRIDIEEKYNESLASEMLLSDILMVVACVCMLISMMGVFSIVSLSLEQRRKEVAIRRINGAKIMDILRLFMGTYVGILFLSAIVAFPVGCHLVNMWLVQYSNHISIPWWLYPSIFLAVFLIVFLLVSGKVMLAMRDKPAMVVKE